MLTLALPLNISFRALGCGDHRLRLCAVFGAARHKRVLLNWCELLLFIAAQDLRQQHYATLAHAAVVQGNGCKRFRNEFQRRISWQQSCSGMIRTQKFRYDANENS